MLTVSGGINVLHCKHLAALFLSRLSRCKQTFLASKFFLLLKSSVSFTQLIQSSSLVTQDNGTFFICTYFQYTFVLRQQAPNMYILVYECLLVNYLFVSNVLWIILLSKTLSQEGSEHKLIIQIDQQSTIFLFLS